MVGDSEEPKLKSKYSSGVNIIIRIDFLWKDTHTHSRLGLYNKWNNDLDRIWLELARDLSSEKETGEEKSEFEKKAELFKAFDTRLSEVGPIVDFKNDGFKDPIKEEIENRGKHYTILMDKQLWLARLENFLGKGTTSEDEDVDDFD